MTLLDISKKDVIDINTGANLGKTDDVDIDSETSKVNSLILYGRKKCLGFLGSDNDLIIPWEKIINIGEDVVMVKNVVFEPNIKLKNNFFTK